MEVAVACQVAPPLQQRESLAGRVKGEMNAKEHSTRGRRKLEKARKPPKSPLRSEGCKYRQRRTKAHTRTALPTSEHTQARGQESTQHS